MDKHSDLILHLIGNVPGIQNHLTRQFGAGIACRQYAEHLLVFVADRNRGPLFTDAAFVDYGLDFEAAYAIAKSNTERLLLAENLRIIHSGLLGYVECDGNWLPNLILMDWFWENPLLQVTEDVIVGIPTRGMLVFIDSAKMPLSLMLMQEVGRQYDRGPHRISPELFIRKNGRFEPFQFVNAPARKWWQFWKK